MINLDFIPHRRPILTDEELVNNAKSFYDQMKNRRTIRHFSNKKVPKEVIEYILKTASSAPSGANKQPWAFAVISSPEMKHTIRLAAEKEEEQNYNGRMSEAWLDDLRPLGTDANKPFLEDAPHLIAVFKKAYEITPEGKKKNYYVNESVGIACGFLISAIHHAGLITLTHTPSPMNFLEKILNRPKNERAYLLIPIGYPEEEVKVPNLERKSLNQVMKIY